MVREGNSLAFTHPSRHEPQVAHSGQCTFRDRERQESRVGDMQLFWPMLCSLFAERFRPPTSLWLGRVKDSHNFGGPMRCTPVEKASSG
jgi:hypothetical protein